MTKNDKYEPMYKVGLESNQTCSSIAMQIYIIRGSSTINPILIGNKKGCIVKKQHKNMKKDT